MSKNHNETVSNAVTVIKSVKEEVSKLLNDPEIFGVKAIMMAHLDKAIGYGEGIVNGNANPTNGTSTSTTYEAKPLGVMNGKIVNKQAAAEAGLTTVLQEKEVDETGNLTDFTETINTPNGTIPPPGTPKAVIVSGVADGKDRLEIPAADPNSEAGKQQAALKQQAQEQAMRELQQKVDTYYPAFLDTSTEEILESIDTLTIRGVAVKAGLPYTEAKPAQIGVKQVEQIKDAIRKKNELSQLGNPQGEGTTTQQTGATSAEEQNRTNTGGNSENV